MTLKNSLRLFATVPVGAVLLTGVSFAEDKEKKEEAANEKGLSLEPTRKIDLRLEEGSWISLDISPDGQTIVFDLLGDLHTVPITGGEASRIVGGMAFDSQPAFSPDGNWIAFVSDRNGSENIWICKRDGSEPKAITKGKRSNYSSPVWTSDSRYIIAAKGERSTDLWMYHIDGGSGVRIDGAEEEERERSPRSSEVHLGPEPSPDGRFLYYSKRSGKSVYNQMSFDWDIYRRNMVTGDEDRVTQAEFGAFRPVLSPDGKKLVYGTRFDGQTGLRIRELDSGNDRWLKYPVQRDEMESLASMDLFPVYAFTPDGSEIVFTNSGKIWRVNVETGEERGISFVADASQEVGPLLNFQRRVSEGPVRSRLIRYPTQSPDGSSILFSAMAKIYVMSLAERQPRRLTESDDWEFKPSWSPDGRWVTYVTWDGQGQGHIWKAPADRSSAPQRLTQTPAFYTDPTFAPDGNRIVARRGNAWMRSQTPSEFGGLRISLDLIWLPSEGGEARLIVPARGLGSPHFGPEEDRIYVYSSKGLVSLRYDGTDRRTHLKVLGKKRPGGREPAPADEVQMSPDGRWALAKLSNQLYLIAVPFIGGEGASVDVFSPQVPVKRLTSLGADSFAWAEQGRTISWSVGSTYFRRPVAGISFEKKDDESDAESKEENGADEGTSAKERKALEKDDSVESFEAVIEFPRHRPEGNIVLRGATLLTMNDGEVIEDADLLISGNRIKALGKKGSLE
ncbi:MAG: PD40 domain-containing protein, partial [Acidobacteriota bacterium]